MQILGCAMLGLGGFAIVVIAIVIICMVVEYEYDSWKEFISDFTIQFFLVILAICSIISFVGVSLI